MILLLLLRGKCGLLKMQLRGVFSRGQFFARFKKPKRAALLSLTSISVSRPGAPVMIRWELTPEETAVALAEGKARGLPDGWDVTLDVSIELSKSELRGDEAIGSPRPSLRLCLPRGFSLL